MQRRRNKQHHYAEGDVETEIAALGLRIKTIAADGNCFYRAVLDQLQVSSCRCAAAFAYGRGHGGSRDLTCHNWHWDAGVP